VCCFLLVGGSEFQSGPWGVPDHPLLPSQHQQGTHHGISTQHRLPPLTLWSISFMDSRNGLAPISTKNLDDF
jgi:hypothetical protein